MTTNSTAPEVPSPHKRKLSTKATTNGDPQVDRKQKKLEATVKKSVTAPTKKRTSTTMLTTKTTSGTSKAAPVPKWASAKALAAKGAQKRATVEIEEVGSDESDSYTSIPPRNPKHVLEASDDDDEGITNPALKLIVVEDDDDDDEEEDEDTNLEAPNESAEAELGMRFNFVLNWTNFRKLLRTLIKRLDITYLYLFQERSPDRVRKRPSSPCVWVRCGKM